MTLIKRNGNLDDINGSATDEEAGGWYINKNCNLDSLYEHVSNPFPSVGVRESSSPCLSLETMTPLHVPLISSLITNKQVEDIEGAFFKVPARQRSQKLLHFGRCKDETWKYV